MTNADLKTMLMASPSDAIAYIVNNNPDAVIDRLRGYNFNIARFEDIEQALNELLDRGEREKFVNALSVPMLTENMDPADVIAVKDAAIALNARSGRNMAQKKLDVEALFAGLAQGTLTYIDSTGGKVTVKPDSGKTPTTPAKDNTWLIIGLGIAALNALVVLYLMLRKK